jgi:hypothetical protein
MENNMYFENINDIDSHIKTEKELTWFEYFKTIEEKDDYSNDLEILFSKQNTIKNDKINYGYNIIIDFLSSKQYSGDLEIYRKLFLYQFSIEKYNDENKKGLEEFDYF